MSKRDRVRLRVEAEPGVTITVLNADLQPVADGIGSLEEEFPPGLYDLRFVAGHAIGEKVVRLGSENLRYRAPTVAFHSPALITQSVAEDEITSRANRLSRRPNERVGRGAQLLVVVLDEAPVARANAAAGLTVRSLEGKLLASFERLSMRSREGSQPVWAVGCLELDPGPYRLRVATGTATLEQMIILVEDWQTQVFLDRKSWGASPARRRASLPDASVLLSPMRRDFDPFRADLRLTELARIALLDRRPVLAPQDLNEMIYGKWENPMLGLYAANLLLATNKGTPQLINKIRHNLRQLLGNHPDVAALDLRAGETVDPIKVPPMLRASWDTVVAASATRPDLVAADSLAGRIAEHLFGTGMWLTWRSPIARSATKPSQTAETPLSKAIALVVSAVAVAVASEGLAAALSPAGQSVVALATEVGRQMRSRRAAKRPELSDEDVVEALGVPRSVAAVAVDDALQAFRGQS
jgi:hypothetical protein